MISFKTCDAWYYFIKGDHITSPLNWYIYVFSAVFVIILLDRRNFKVKIHKIILYILKNTLKNAVPAPAYDYKAMTFEAEF